MSTQGYELAPDDLNSNLPEWCRRISQTLNGAMSGRTNNTDQVTLTANASSTTVNLARGRLAENSLILFDPLTANAATELAAGTMYILNSNRSVTNATFTITHANNAQTDRSFRYAIVG